MSNHWVNSSRYRSRIIRRFREYLVTVDKEWGGSFYNGEKIEEACNRKKMEEEGTRNHLLQRDTERKSWRISQPCSLFRPLWSIWCIHPPEWLNAIAKKEERDWKRKEKRRAKKRWGERWKKRENESAGEIKRRSDEGRRRKGGGEWRVESGGKRRRVQRE